MWSFPSFFKSFRFDSLTLLPGGKVLSDYLLESSHLGDRQWYCGSTSMLRIAIVIHKSEFCVCFPIVFKLSKLVLTNSLKESTTKESEMDLRCMFSLLQNRERSLSSFHKTSWLYRRRIQEIKTEGYGNSKCRFLAPGRALARGSSRNHFSLWNLYPISGSV